MAQIGVNAWVWSSPVNTAEFGRLAPIVAQMGFDLIEVGIESTSDLDYGRAAEIAKANGLAVSVCAAMGPDRDLIHADEGIRDQRDGLRAALHRRGEDAGRAARDRSALQRGRPHVAGRPTTSGSTTSISWSGSSASWRSTRGTAACGSASSR